MRPLLPALAVVLSACASDPRPVFYPNETWQEAGERVAQRDADDCMALADAHGHTAKGTGQRASEGAVSGGVLGALVGGAIGWVLGNPGRGAGAGAAGGGTRGAVRGATSPDHDDRIRRAFVQRCLAERGYEIVGWD